MVLLPPAILPFVGLLDVVHLGLIHGEDEAVLLDQLIGNIFVAEGFLILLAFRFEAERSVKQVLGRTRLDLFDHVLLDGRRVFDDPLVVSTERELRNIRVERAHAAASVFSESTHIDLLVVALRCIRDIVLVELFLVAVADLLLKVLLEHVYLQATPALGVVA